jgi:hypothetical protein
LHEVLAGAEHALAEGDAIDAIDDQGVEGVEEAA